MRECFDRSARWFRDLVRLQDAIVLLPGLADALSGADGGPPIGRRAALCIAPVAVPENVHEWIAKARGNSLLELQDLVAAARPGTEAHQPTPTTKKVCVRLQGPPEVELAYAAVRDLHDAIIGREAGAAAFVEALVGETASSGCEMAPDLHPSFLARQQQRATNSAGDSRSSTGTTRRPVALHGSTPAARRALQLLRDYDTVRSRLGQLQATIADDSTGPTEAGAGACQIERLSMILRRLVDLESWFDIAIADLLLELHERRAWRSLGFSGLEDCAENLGVGGSTARRRVTVARRARRYDSVRCAYESGQLGEEKTLWVTQRLEGLHTTSATPWIEHASRASVKHLRDEAKCWRRESLRRRIEVADAMTPGHVDEPGTTARRAPIPMTEVEVHAARRRSPGSTRNEVFGLAHGLLERAGRGGPLVPTTWRVELPVELAADLVACIEGARRALQAQATASITAADQARLRPSARLALVMVERQERLPDWLGLLAILEECVWVWDAPESQPRRTHAAIFSRDGFRCMAPGCTGRRHLETHHLKYRSRGGTDVPTNLIVLCRFHHQQGEHGLQAHCEGQAPLDIVWRLGRGELSTWWRNEMRLTLRPPRDELGSAYCGPFTFDLP